MKKCECESFGAAWQDFSDNMKAAGFNVRIVIENLDGSPIMAEADGGSSGHLKRKTCPPTCTQTQCDNSYNTFDQLWIACGNNTACQAIVETQYNNAPC